MREFLEFHDSELRGAQRSGSDLRLELLAYVHRWIDGEGTGWTFPATIVLRGAKGQVESALPVNIANGTFTVEGVEFDNLIELPFSRSGPTEFTLVTVDGKTFVVTSAGIRIGRAAEGKFIEALPASFNPDDGR